MDDPFLYPWFAQEARRRDELALWRARHRAQLEPRPGMTMG